MSDTRPSQCIFLSKTVNLQDGWNWFPRSSRLISKLFAERVPSFCTNNCWNSVKNEHLIRLLIFFQRNVSFSQLLVTRVFFYIVFLQLATCRTAFQLPGAPVYFSRKILNCLRWKLMSKTPLCSGYMYFW